MTIAELRLVLRILNGEYVSEEDYKKAIWLVEREIIMRVRNPVTGKDDE